MGTLIDDLLTFSRVSRIETRMGLIDMEKLINNAYQDLLQAEKNKTRIEFRLNKLPKVKGDKEMIKHVISNLLGNAIKFSKEREKAIIEVSAETRLIENIYHIKDNGAGFEMEYANKLFEIFQRLHSDEEFEGTGVGLAIVQRIIEKHHGRVWASSELNKGATFYFSLPN